MVVKRGREEGRGGREGGMSELINEKEVKTKGKGLKRGISREAVERKSEGSESMVALESPARTKGPHNGAPGTRRRKPPGESPAHSEEEL